MAGPVGLFAFNAALNLVGSTAVTSTSTRTRRVDVNSAGGTATVASKDARGRRDPGPERAGHVLHADLRALGPAARRLTMKARRAGRRRAARLVCYVRSRRVAAGRSSRRRARSSASTHCGSNCVPALRRSSSSASSRRQRLAVGAAARDRVEGVGDVQDAAGGRDRLAAAGRPGSRTRRSARASGGSRARSSRGPGCARPSRRPAPGSGLIASHSCSVSGSRLRRMWSGIETLPTSWRIAAIWSSSRSRSGQPSRCAIADAVLGDLPRVLVLHRHPLVDRPRERRRPAQLLARSSGPASRAPRLPA